MLFTDLSVKRERDTKMKKIVLFLSLGLVCVLAIPAFAADYTVAPPTQALFGTPTSVDVVTVGNNINRTAVDISKNSALIPPAFGSHTSNLKGSGEPLTPNLASYYTETPQAPVSVSGITEQPLVTVTSTVPNSSVTNGNGVTIIPGNIDTDIYEDYYTYDAFTEVDDDMYYSGGYIAKLSIPDIDLSVKVYEGTTNSVLSKGVGHFKETSIWDGNVCLASHNRGTGAYFSDIHELDLGATIKLTTKLGTRKYEVYSIEKISVDDTSDLQNTSDNIITLITCVKNQSDYYRWCVKAEQVD